MNSSSLSSVESLSDQDTVLLIDNFEAKPEAKSSEGNIDILCRILDEKKFRSVVLSARSIENLDLRLRRRFPVEIELMVPSPDERLEILKLILEDETISEEEIKELARHTHGFTGADLVALAKVADLYLENKVSNNNSEGKVTDYSSETKFLAMVLQLTFQVILSMKVLRNSTLIGSLLLEEKYGLQESVNSS